MTLRFLLVLSFAVLGLVRPAVTSVDAACPKPPCQDPGPAAGEQTLPNASTPTRVNLPAGDSGPKIVPVSKPCPVPPCGDPLAPEAGTDLKSTCPSPPCSDPKQGK